MTNAMTITFKGKRQTDSEGVDYVRLVKPAPHHINGEQPAVGLFQNVALPAVWSYLFPGGRVTEACPLVTRWEGDYMVTVEVQLPDVSKMRKEVNRRHEHIDALRKAGHGLMESEDMVHDSYVRKFANMLGE